MLSYVDDYDAFFYLYSKNKNKNKPSGFKIKIKKPTFMLIIVNHETEKYL